MNSVISIGIECLQILSKRYTQPNHLNVFLTNISLYKAREKNDNKEWRKLGGGKSQAFDVFCVCALKCRLRVRRYLKVENGKTGDGMDER